MSTKEPCALCSQAVEIKGFSLQTKEGQKNFCCEGCLSIYHLLNEDKLITTTTNENKK